MRPEFDGLDPKRVVDQNVFLPGCHLLIWIASSREASRYNDIAGRRLSAMSTAIPLKMRRRVMRRAVLTALAATALAFGMAAPAPVQAATELSLCTEANVWSVEVIDLPILGGYAQLYYLCTADGWMLFGATYCVGGDCSSD